MIVKTSIFWNHRITTKVGPIIVFAINNILPIWGFITCWNCSQFSQVSIIISVIICQVNEVLSFNQHIMMSNRNRSYTLKSSCNPPDHDKYTMNREKNIKLRFAFFLLVKCSSLYFWLNLLKHTLLFVVWSSFELNSRPAFLWLYHAWIQQNGQTHVNPSHRAVHFRKLY